MSMYVDEKYVRLVSTKLRNFKVKGKHTYNCACPICGDSKKSKLKARGYFLPAKRNMYYTCHNCNKSYTIQNFLKLVDHNLYTQYKIESYKERNNIVEEKVSDYSIAATKPVFEHKINLPKVSELTNDHIARKYVIDRSIPEFHWDRLYYAEDFLKFCDEMYPEHGKKLPRDDMRLVIPFWDQKKILQGVQGRTLSNSEVRYITIRAREDMTKVFGLDIVDFTKPITIVEGPIDSMFLKNSLATMDAALYRVIDQIGDHDFVFCYDNEPRNENVLKTMRKTINMGKKIVIFPSNVTQKDINDMILAGVNVEEIIQNRTYQGPRAMLEFEMWRKV